MTTKISPQIEDPALIPVSIAVFKQAVAKYSQLLIVCEVDENKNSTGNYLTCEIHARKINK